MSKVSNNFNDLLAAVKRRSKPSTTREHDKQKLEMNKKVKSILNILQENNEILNSIWYVPRRSQIISYNCRVHGWPWMED